MDWLPTDVPIDWLSSKLGLEANCEEEERACQEGEDKPDRRRRLDDAKKPQWTKTQKSGSGNLMRNMGIMFVVAFCIVLFLLLFRLLRCIALSNYRYFRIYMTVHDAIFYNLFIRYVIQSTLKIQVAALTTLIAAGWSSTSGIIQSLLSLLLLACLGIAPIVFGVVLYKNMEDLSYRKLEKKIGSMY